MKKKIIMAVLCLSGMAAQAQQNLNWGQGPQVASPVVNADKTVTFNLIAPEAQKVQITGDFLPSKKIEYQGNSYETPGVADLVKDDKGIWSFTSSALKSASSVRAGIRILRELGGIGLSSSIRSMASGGTFPVIA